jgi:farnesyl diphosphate synthase
MRDMQTRIEEYLARTLPDRALAPSRLHEAMRYAILGGGKRVRPLLTFAAGTLVEASIERLEVAAAVVELVHGYSLVHDDLPCMDDDELRRGKPATHIQFDEATALLAGDSLQSLAFQLLAEYRIADAAETQLRMIETLARAIGSRGMAGGQAIDLESVDRPLALPALEFMHIHKTGALIRAAVTLGSLCGASLPPIEQRHLDSFSKSVGLAFQVIDDILDAQSSTATLGKTAGKDARTNKPTYVSIMGLSAAQLLAKELIQKALSSLDGFDSRADRLRQIAQFVLTRPY